MTDAESRRCRRWAVAGWSVVGFATLLIVSILVSDYLIGDLTFSDFPVAFAFFSYAAVGAVLMVRVPGHRLGPLFAFVGLAPILGGAVYGFALRFVPPGAPPPGLTSPVRRHLLDPDAGGCPGLPGPPVPHGPSAEPAVVLGRLGSTRARRRVRRADRLPARVRRDHLHGRRGDRHQSDRHRQHAKPGGQLPGRARLPDAGCPVAVGAGLAGGALPTGRCRAAGAAEMAAVRGGSAGRLVGPGHRDRGRTVAGARSRIHPCIGRHPCRRGDRHPPLPAVRHRRCHQQDPGVRGVGRVRHGRVRGAGRGDRRPGGGLGQPGACRSWPPRWWRSPSNRCATGCSAW